MEFQGHEYRSGSSAEPEHGDNPVRSSAARPSAANNSGKKKSNKLPETKWGRIGVAAFGLLIVALFVLVIITVGLSNKNSEASIVDNDRLQAVFLETGQVYFGKITSISDDYVDLQGIYYLQTASGSTDAKSTDNTNVSLVKLGCELHAPSDRMIITRDQITFWENLQTTGQVAKAVATFEKDNPNGQKCSDTPASNSTNVQGSTNTPATTAKQ